MREREREREREGQEQREIINNRGRWGGRKRGQE